MCLRSKAKLFLLRKKVHDQPRRVHSRAACRACAESQDAVRVRERQNAPAVAQAKSRRICAKYRGGAGCISSTHGLVGTTSAKHAESRQFELGWAHMQDSCLRRVPPAQQTS